MKVLILNAGSSTLKFSVFDAEGERLLGEGQAEWSRQPARLSIQRAGEEEIQSDVPLQHHADAIGRVLHELTQGARPILRELSNLGAVGHRVVHGGPDYTTSVRITAEVRSAIGKLAELAPLHNPANLEGIEAASQALPGVPQVAVFDTAFHATISEAARTYPLPQSWIRDWGLRRYGFHGISHAYCASRAAALLGPRPGGLRLVICHLGNGCSASAVRDGICLDTSMGFTPLEGLMMGTRSGSVDPGLLLYVLRRRGVSPEELDEVLNHRSGLLGVSGISFDMRAVLAAAREGNADAQLALAIYTHRIRKTIGALTAVLGGLDAVVFTAGVGEHAAEVRAAACREMEYLGLQLDPAANDRCQPDADVALPDSRVRILVLHTREDLVILRETLRLARHPA